MSYSTIVTMIEKYIDELDMCDINGLDDSVLYVPKKTFRNRANGEIEKVIRQKIEDRENMRRYLEYVKKDVMNTMKNMISNIEKTNYKLEEMNFFNNRMLESKKRMNEEEKKMKMERDKRYEEEEKDMKKEMTMKREREFDEILSSNNFNQIMTVHPLPFLPQSTLPPASFSFDMSASPPLVVGQLPAFVFNNQPPASPPQSSSCDSLFLNVGSVLDALEKI